MGGQDIRGTSSVQQSDCCISALQNHMPLEVLVAANRAEAAACGLVLRPPLFQEDAQLVADSPVRNAEASSPVPSSEPGTPASYTPASTFFLHVRGPREGVLSVHRATWIKV